MSHLGKQNIKCLQEISTNMAWSNNVYPCTDCILEKMKEKPYNKPSPRRKYLLKYIHTDIAGFFPVFGYNRYQYWVTFLDNATQLSTTILITYKNEMFAELRKFLAKYEQLKRQCHCIHLDDSGKNRSNKFREWCAQRKILVEVTTTNQDQQNGTAKSLNWVIMDKLHPTLLSAHLDKKWWPEILLTVNYLCNLSSSLLIKKTLFKAWYNEKPDLSHICIISSTAYTKKIESKRQKLVNKKASSCKLLGYDSNSIYQLLMHDNRVIRFTNVEFVKQRPFKYTYSDHFYTPQLEPSKIDNTSNPSRKVSKARQLEESTCGHTPAQ